MAADARVDLRDDRVRRRDRARPTPPSFNSEDVDIVGDQVVQHGNLAGGFTGVDVTGRDGVVTHADVYAWPQDLLTIADSQALDSAGGIWLATPPEEGDVTFIQGRRGATDVRARRDADRSAPPDPGDRGWPRRVRERPRARLGDPPRQRCDPFLRRRRRGSRGQLLVRHGRLDSGRRGGRDLPHRHLSPERDDLDGHRRRLRTARRRHRRAIDARAGESMVSPANLWLVALPGSGTGVSRGHGLACRRSFRGRRRCIRTDCSAPAAMAWSRGASCTTPTSARS